MRKEFLNLILHIALLFLVTFEKFQQKQLRYRKYYECSTKYKKLIAHSMSAKSTYIYFHPKK